MNEEIQNKITKIFPWFNNYAECGDGYLLGDIVCLKSYQ